MRRRGGLNRIGLLALALVLALGVMGLAYGAWVDDVYITGTLSTSSINAGLSCGTCSVQGTPANPTSISCSKTAPMTLNIEVTSAQQNVDYYCNFIVSNAAGSLPIKIASMSLTDSYTGVTEVIELLTVGTVIDPGQSATGRVHIHLTSAASVGANISTALAVTVARWNE